MSCPLQINSKMGTAPNFIPLDLETDEEYASDPFHGVDSKYIAEKDLGAFFKFKDNLAINVMHVNARSLKKNLCNLESLLNNIPGPVSAIAVTETWLTEHTKDVIFIPNYNFFSNCRSNKNGGGVGIFVHSSLNVSIRNTWNRMMHCIESIFIEILQPNNKNIIIGAIYRPPGGDQNTLNMFNAEICSILNSINHEKNKTVIISGDFNLDLIQYGTHRPMAEFLDNLLSFSFCPSINQPTRISDISSTLIDNIFINCNPDKFDSAIICNDISDHLPVAVHVKSCTSAQPNNKNKVSQLKTRVYKQEMVTNFNNG